ncbi:hypothetical protein [Phytopseudomonas flavescens]|uniref:hypothetical protein n=1 Tax=Phytopseudomonas flavescens TaxID=29435 RepID=UPI0011142701|nr:hypothetical protein [Pseudomonas flavescens]
MTACRHNRLENPKSASHSALQTDESHEKEPLTQPKTQYLLGKRSENLLLSISSLPPGKLAKIVETSCLPAVSSITWELTTESSFSSDPDTGFN